MPYVRRNALGQIDSLHRQRSAGIQEYLPDEIPTCRPLSVRPTPLEDFGRLDADFVRVIEDVIDTLIMKNVLNITDLPSEAASQAVRAQKLSRAHHAQFVAPVRQFGLQRSHRRHRLRRPLKTRSSDQQPAHTRVFSLR